MKKSSVLINTNYSAGVKCVLLGPYPNASMLELTGDDRLRMVFGVGLPIVHCPAVYASMVLSSESMLFWHFSHDQQPWTPGFPHRYLSQHPFRAPHHQPGPSGHLHCPGRAGLHPGHQPTTHGLCSQHCSKFVICSAWSCCNVLDGSFRGPVERLMNSKFTKIFICNLFKIW